MPVDFVLSDVLGAVLLLTGIPAAYALATWAIYRYREDVITITVHEPRKPMSARRARRYR